MIALTQVDNSQQIAAHGYDEAQGVLRVQFKNGGKVYDYPGVTPEDAAGLADAKSIGRYMSSVIKAQYVGTLVTQDEQEAEGG